MDNGDRTPLVAFLLLLGLFGFLVFRMLAPYLLALFLGGTLALLSHPLYSSFQAKGMGPKSAAALVTLAIFLLIIGPFSTLGILAVRQGVVLGRSLAEQEEFSPPALSERFQRWVPAKTLLWDPREAAEQLRFGIRRGGQLATAAILKLAKRIPEFLLQAALTSLACFFFLIDGSRFVAWVLRKSPLDKDVRRKVIDSFTDMTVSTLWAGLAAAGTQAGVMLLAFLVLGIPGAFLAAGTTFILSWIPVIGSVPVSMAAVLYLYSQGSMPKLFVMIGLGVFTTLVDNIVRPWVLKGRNDMHPFVGLIATVAGIHMFGIFGVLIGPVLATILISLLEIWPSIARRFGLSFESNGK